MGCLNFCPALRYVLIFSLTVYETGISYQNTESYRPGTDPLYPAPHQQNNITTVPIVTVTTPAKNARLEFVE